MSESQSGSGTPYCRPAIWNAACSSGNVIGAGTVIRRHTGGLTSTRVIFTWHTEPANAAFASAVFALARALADFPAVAVAAFELVRRFAGGAAADRACKAPFRAAFATAVSG